ncbi:AlpA family phage regulatory protein [Novosphingobium sp. 1949]|uniref:AlpA family phage regulatory protein n=1 Tax=Novosphingobium organovorum TaxID=2930092 RepID=A0ABT0BGA6_9SPHN|nr:AlpA family phage regulatory protein [Novosphingobium organovorum]MCJ2184105.1 AlpA family phage regulatory protein [Novosphingobium organovorum]
MPGARATLYRRIQAGAFPAQVKISARCSAWRESEVEAWMRDPFGFANSLRDDA